MVEILGQDLSFPFEHFGIYADMTYKQLTPHRNEPLFEVWEMEDLEFEKICDISDEEWNNLEGNSGWWRHSVDCNLGEATHEIMINRYFINGWLLNDDFECLNEDDEEPKNTCFEYLLDYIYTELRISTEKNITAITIGLAKRNNMSLSELFHKCQGNDM